MSSGVCAEKLKRERKRYRKRLSKRGREREGRKGEQTSEYYNKLTVRANAVLALYAPKRTQLFLL